MDLPPKKRAPPRAAPPPPAAPGSDPGANEGSPPLRASKIEGVAPYRRPRVGPQYQATLPDASG